MESRCKTRWIYWFTKTVRGHRSGIFRGRREGSDVGTWTRPGPAQCYCSAPRHVRFNKTWCPNLQKETRPSAGTWAGRDCSDGFAPFTPTWAAAFSCGPAHERWHFTWESVTRRPSQTCAQLFTRTLSTLQRRFVVNWWVWVSTPPCWPTRCITDDIHADLS